MFSTKSYTRFVAVIAISFAAVCAPVHAAPPTSSNQSSPAATSGASWTGSQVNWIQTFGGSNGWRDLWLTALYGFC
jgi:hypothetical protein